MSTTDYTNGTPGSSGAGAGAGAGAGPAGPSPGLAATPKAASTKKSRSKTNLPTPLDGQFMLTVVMMHKGPLDVNWDDLANELGFKNAGVAKTRFGQIKSKYRNNATEAGDDADADADNDELGYAADAAATPTPTPASRVKGGKVVKTTPRKRATPAKKTPGSRKKGVKKEVEEEEEGEGELEQALVKQEVGHQQEGEQHGYEGGEMVHVGDEFVHWDARPTNGPAWV